MPIAPNKFADLLTKAIYQIKGQERKNIELIQDELGYVLEREGGSFINYLRKGNVPTKLVDTEVLTRELVRRGALDRVTCGDFLTSADYPGVERLVEELFTLSLETTIDEADERQSENLVPLDTKTFIAGPPIVAPHQFFGRERELRRIFRHWQRTPMEHVTIIGPRRSGKTSLLHYIRRIATAEAADLRPQQKQDWLDLPEAYQWIWVDFQDPRMRNLEQLLRHLLAALNEPIPLPCNLDTFMDRITSRVWQHPVIVLMDEVGIGISSPEIPRNFWDALRSLIMSNVTKGNLGFMLAAHGSLVELAEDRGKASPFWNMFITEKLGPLTEVEARQLLASSPIRFAKQDVEWIMQKSQLWPCLLQYLASERLMALEEDELGDGWREEGLRHIAPFAHLLEPNDVKTSDIKE